MTQREIFERALQIADPQQRSDYLREASGSDQALAQQIEKLLAAHAAAGSFLESPAGMDPAARATLASTPPPTLASAGSAVGDVIAGKYKLLQIIGEGGMGIVYMAEQRQPMVRRVALKIIKPGMHSTEILARFEAERQALAVMDHPHIAKVFDAGTTDAGLPFFVMELVHGIPITRHCDEALLTLNERLTLFVPVCQAVQHAHQKGVIHRDLKPSNVLIAQYDSKPVPKVIDFGVAKAVGQKLTERTLFTQFGAVVGTLEYMSPEQATLNALDVDTRSDIYSLGVLLYELLTGETPMDRQTLQTAAFDEVLRIIRCDEPPKPSTRLSSSARLPAIAAGRRVEPHRLTSQVRGELDWIVMKSLEKERDRRYGTAKELAEDIERFLAGRPVAAGPPSSWYRLRKFGSRNRGRLLALASLAAVVVVAAGIIFWLANRNQRLEVVATAEQKRATDAQLETKEVRTQARKGQIVTAFLGQVFEAAKDYSHNANAMFKLLDKLPLGDPNQERAQALTSIVEGSQARDPGKVTEALDLSELAIPEHDDALRLFLAATQKVIAGCRLAEQGKRDQAAALFDAADAKLNAMSKLPALAYLPPHAVDQLRDTIKAAREGKPTSNPDSQ